LPPTATSRNAKAWKFYVHPPGTAASLFDKYKY